MQAALAMDHGHLCYDLTTLNPDPYPHPAPPQAALAEARPELSTLYQKVKGGRPQLMLAEWQKLLQKQLLFGEFATLNPTRTRTRTRTPDPDPDPNPNQASSRSRSTPAG